MKPQSLLIFLVFVVAANQPSFARNEFAGEYQSPYKVVFTVPLSELTAPDHVSPRGDSKLESRTPYEDWYSARIRNKFGAWGPEPRRFPVIEGLDTLSADWKRQRVLAVAYELIGLPYQHHHIPDWDPPTDWPWKQVAYGRNSKGMDCSDFSSWCYNYGLGIKLKTGIGQQADSDSVAIQSQNDVVPIQKIYDDGGYDALLKKLLPGDLLYIKRKDQAVIGHVVIWVGKHGQSPDGVPLVIDCTGPEHTDCNGRAIPIGVQIRPFTRDGWYYKSFDHANRIIQ